MAERAAELEARRVAKFDVTVAVKLEGLPTRTPSAVCDRAYPAPVVRADAVVRVSVATPATDEPRTRAAFCVAP